MPTPAYIPGKALHATVGGAAATVKKSNITCKADVLKCTNAQSGGYQEVIAGILSFSGSLTLVVDAGAAPTVVTGSIVAVVIGVTGGRSISGSALISEVQDSADVEGDYEMTLTIESTGTIVGY